MIDYRLLAYSNEYYEKHGFVRIEAPWTVSEYVDDITRPKDRIHFQFKHNDKCFVASGEQSFLYLYLKNFLPKGSYQCTTPCMRFEPFDGLHTKYFMKTELIKTDVVNDEELKKMVIIAKDFYETYLGKKNVEVVKTEQGYDLRYKNIELGSYGIRKCSFLKWIYGTGCAEPRLSTLIEHGVS